MTVIGGGNVISIPHAVALRCLELVLKCRNIVANVGMRMIWAVIFLIVVGCFALLFLDHLLLNSFLLHAVVVIVESDKVIGSL